MQLCVLQVPHSFRADELLELESRLSVEERRRCQALHFEEHAQRQILSFALQRHILGAHLGLRSSEVKIIRADGAKPFVHEQGCFFSASHSGAWIGVVLDTDEVGLDIQKREAKVPENMIKLFHVAEQERIQQASSSVDEFYKIWVAKESLLKATGYGLSIPLDSFQIPSENAAECKVHFDERNWWVHHMDIDANYPLAICSRHSKPIGKWRGLQIHDLL